MGGLMGTSASDFMEKYTVHYIKKMEAEGASAEEIRKKISNDATPQFHRKESIFSNGFKSVGRGTG